MARELGHRRLLVAIGQAGDRDDQAIRALAAAALHMGPDRIIIKELDPYRRGREIGEVPKLIEDELRRRGAPNELWQHSPSEVEAVRSALEWAEEGDLLILTVQSRQDEILEMLQDLVEARWRPGRELP